MSNGRFPLSKRLTHKYRDGWSYEDQWEVIGTRGENFNSYIFNDKEESFSHMFDVAVFAEHGKESEIPQALRDTFSNSNCRHEHDCCGCKFTRVVGIEHRLGRIWRVTQHVYYNI